MQVSANVTYEVENDISATLGISLTNNLGKYLGILSIHGRVTVNSFKYILDKVYNRLAG